MSRVLLTVVFLLAVAPAFADPMRPDPRQPRETSRPAPAPEPRLKLTSVYIVADQRFAVINQQWLAVGDTLHNYTVTDIAPSEVVLRRGQQTRKLTLSQPGELSITATNED